MEHECAWCGATEPDISFCNPHWYPNRRGEWFCNPSHRSGSNRALKRFEAQDESPQVPGTTAEE